MICQPGMLPAPRRLLSLVVTAYPLCNSPLSNTDPLSEMALLNITVPASLVYWTQPDVVDAALRSGMYIAMIAASSVGVAAGAPTPNSARAHPVLTTVPINDAAAFV